MFFRTKFCVALTPKFKTAIDDYFPTFQDSEASGWDTSKVYGGLKTVRYSGTLYEVSCKTWPKQCVYPKEVKSFAALGGIANCPVRAHPGTLECAHCVSNSTSRDLSTATYCISSTTTSEIPHLSCGRAGLGIVPFPVTSCMALSVRSSLHITTHIASPSLVDLPH